MRQEIGRMNQSVKIHKCARHSVVDMVCVVAAWGGSIAFISYTCRLVSHIVVGNIQLARSHVICHRCIIITAIVIVISHLPIVNGFCIAHAVFSDAEGHFSLRNTPSSVQATKNNT